MISTSSRDRTLAERSAEDDNATQVNDLRRVAGQKVSTVEVPGQLADIDRQNGRFGMLANCGVVPPIRVHTHEDDELVDVL